LNDDYLLDSCGSMSIKLATKLRSLQALLEDILFY